MKHLLSIEKLPLADLQTILKDAVRIKKDRGTQTQKVLTGQAWAMLFSKSSTRTRVSFEVGIRELGGETIFLAANEIQLGRGEPIKDTARVLGRMVHGAVFRTFSQAEVEEFAQYAGIPTINALTDDEHPCQIIADIFTFQEKRGVRINGSVVRLARPDALVMHCLPAYRGKEIDEETFEANAQTIFDQAENRLHTQKAALAWLVS